MGERKPINGGLAVESPGSIGVLGQSI